jgi:hypothetical protein
MGSDVDSVCEEEGGVTRNRAKVGMRCCCCCLLLLVFGGECD